MKKFLKDLLSDIIAMVMVLGVAAAILMLSGLPDRVSLWVLATVPLLAGYLHSELRVLKLRKALRLFGSRDAMVNLLTGQAQILDSLCRQEVEAYELWRQGITEEGYQLELRSTRKAIKKAKAIFWETAGLAHEQELLFQLPTSWKQYRPNRPNQETIGQENEAA